MMMIDVKQVVYLLGQIFLILFLRSHIIIVIVVVPTRIPLTGYNKA